MARNHCLKESRLCAHQSGAQDKAKKLDSMIPPGHRPLDWPTITTKRETKGIVDTESNMGQWARKVIMRIRKRAAETLEIDPNPRMNGRVAIGDNIVPESRQKTPPGIRSSSPLSKNVCKISSTPELLGDRTPSTQPGSDLETGGSTNHNDDISIELDAVYFRSSHGCSSRIDFMVLFSSGLPEHWYKVCAFWQSGPGF
ncbi:hypothetical protein CPB84DRAFT_1749331 [Gymnopilus junonius]|uniref:Uncharacterized protein n=1 Tax=Gymnopilus junonius TaxID=109634 RepID=A0A9P5NHZ3_GYMJU|nr:hypothetical protein CPB84DRAFT_1749331 [Gymnopilus junonius]